MTNVHYHCANVRCLLIIH